jgi:hypothetical protein
MLGIYSVYLSKGNSSIERGPFFLLSFHLGLTAPPPIKQRQWPSLSLYLSSLCINSALFTYTCRHRMGGGGESYCTTEKSLIFHFFVPRFLLVYITFTVSALKGQCRFLLSLEIIKLYLSLSFFFFRFFLSFFLSFFFSFFRSMRSVSSKRLTCILCDIWIKVNEFSNQAIFCINSPFCQKGLGARLRWFSITLTVQNISLLLCLLVSIESTYMSTALSWEGSEKNQKTAVFRSCLTFSFL